MGKAQAARYHAEHPPRLPQVKTGTRVQVGSLRGLPARAAKPACLLPSATPHLCRARVNPACTPVRNTSFARGRFSLVP